MEPESAVGGQNVHHKCQQQGDEVVVDRTSISRRPDGRFSSERRFDLTETDKKKKTQKRILVNSVMKGGGGEDGPHHPAESAFYFVKHERT